MSSLFDDNDEAERQAQKLYEFYEVFSLEVRRQLLAKNIPIIQNVYDVLYPQTKNQLLTKNVSSDLTIDSTAESVRNALVAKLVEENLNLDTISENFRNQNLSKNVLADSYRDLQYKIDKVRENLLAKNKKVNSSNIDSVADNERRDALSKNKESLNKDNEIEKDNIYFRENNLYKNTPNKNVGIDQQSDEFRKNNIDKNADSDFDLNRQNNIFRNQNLAKNVKSQLPTNNFSELDAVANEKRAIDESKNVPSQNDGLEKQSESFRDNNLSKNVLEENSLENTSIPIRDVSLSKNDSVENDLLESSNNFRKEDLSKNVQSPGDLLLDSNRTRTDDLSKNTPRETDLLSLSEEARLIDLSKNNSSESDLLTDSNEIRKDDLSKNVPTENDLLFYSEDFRSENLSNNNPKVSDIIVDNEFFRVDNISKNVSIERDLKVDSEDFRVDSLSKNNASESDLLTDSSLIRTDNISSNEPVVGDLLVDSKDFRDDNVSKIVPVVTDLENISENPRADLLSQNVPKDSDLFLSGVAPREDLLAANIPNVGDLLEDSTDFRNGLLATNVPNVGDLLNESEPFKKDLLDKNIPKDGDLLKDSIPYYADNLSANVPNPYNILDASAPYLDANLLPNIPSDSDLLSDSAQALQDNIAPNVPNNSDLLSDSNPYLQNNLSSNNLNDFDLLAESTPIKNSLISKNKPINSDLLAYSTPFKDNLLAQNENTQLGVTFEGLGTFRYLGISRVAAQGLVLRTFLMAKNKGKISGVLDYGGVYKEMQVSKNNYALNKKNYSFVFANKLTDKVSEQGTILKGYNGYSLKTEVATQMNANFYVNENGSELQKKYAPITTDGEGFTKNVSLGGSYFKSSTLSPQGGGFDSNPNAGSVSYIQTFNGGEITSYIRDYNISRNLYNLTKSQGVSEMNTYIGKLNSNNDLGFQDLISKTIKKFHSPDKSVSAQAFGNLIPSNILNENRHLYLRESAEKLMRSGNIAVGTPGSMMQKTIAGNPLQEPAFDTAKRGVKHIMKTIRNNDYIKMSVNYDPQNTNKYLIKQTRSGEFIYARQRFTIANPYSPPYAKSLIFSLKNYSSGDLLYFPPYITDFSDSHSANWNEINFLGRPEPIYTYNNSKRDGTLSFMVLTDFSEIVLMGREWNDADMDKIEKNISASFVNKTKYNVAGGIADLSGLAEQYGISKDNIKELAAFKATDNTSTSVATTGQTEAKGAGDTPAQGAEQDGGETAQQNTQEGLEIAENLNVNAALDSFVETFDEDFIYSLASDTNKNIYDFMTNNITRDLDGQIITTPGETKQRLKAMISNLIFQPSYFSGSKEDFKNRMDFLAKLTKPAEASKGSGYSFTKPPVVHIRLGDWWNHDIVVKTVSVDYTDSPWALDKGRVQPMWAKVTLNFDFVGRYGGEGDPVLSTDTGGVYSP